MYFKVSQLHPVLIAPNYVSFIRISRIASKRVGYFVGWFYY